MSWHTALCWAIVASLAIGRIVVFIAKRRQYKREFRPNPMFARDYSVGKEAK